MAWNIASVRDATRYVEVLRPLEPICTVVFLTMDTTCLAAKRRGRSMTRESSSAPSTPINLHLMQTDDGTNDSDDLPNRTSAALVTFPLLKNPTFVRNASSSREMISSESLCRDS